MYLLYKLRAKFAAFSFWSSELFQEVIVPYLKWKRSIWEGICCENWQVPYMPLKLYLCLIYCFKKYLAFMNFCWTAVTMSPSSLSNLYMRWHCLCTAECGLLFSILHNGFCGDRPHTLKKWQLSFSWALILRPLKMLYLQLLKLPL